MENVYKPLDFISYTINKKVSELTLEDLDKLYTQKIATIIKIINDDEYYIKLEMESNDED